MGYDLSILSVSDHVWDRGFYEGYEGIGDMNEESKRHGPYSCSYIEGYLAGQEAAKNHEEATS